MDHQWTEALPVVANPPTPEEDTDTTEAATHNRRALILRMLIGLALAVAGLAWALRDVGFDQVVQVFGSIRPLPAFTAFACSAMVAVFKAARWRWLYYPHHRRLIYRHIFSTLVIAQMINNISPVRIGEIVRILLIHRRAGVGKAATLSTIVAEKVMDLLCLSGLVLAALAATREWAAMRLGLALVAGGALALAGLGWRRHWLTPWFERLVRFAPPRWQGNLLKTINAVLSAFEPLSDLRGLAPVLGLSIVIWLLSALSFHTALLAFGLDLSWTAPVALLAALQGAVSIPSSPPGYVGVIEAAATTVLESYYRVLPAVAFSASVLIHLVVVGPVLIFGGFSLWLTALSFPLSAISLKHATPASNLELKADR